MADTHPSKDTHSKDTQPELNPNDSNPQDVEDEVQYTPEEEAAAMEESQSLKAEATALFTKGDIHNALSVYEDALMPLPSSARYARAVLHSNIAACHLRVDQPTEAVKAATTALNELSAIEDSTSRSKSDKSDPDLNAKDEKNDDDDDDVTKGKGRKEEREREQEQVDEEIISSGAKTAAPPPPPPPPPAQDDIARIRIKSLLRRARANASIRPETWSSLSSAQTDYQALSKLPPSALTATDARNVRDMLRRLEPKVKEAQEREMGEMWSKLKEMGNGLLKPFGLSTNNFQMVKDEATGGYSMNFNQNAGK
ncbi:Tetratricopeptide repeat protein 1 [Geosmithia morbida]|uniref:Tetratricopeptide repeat protein 1 n=1 Tax=Geosmithia morbida TaxID=1094350 RepID=A0A9P4Z2G7_9HYPO|nr:Tetratricopeptide repeat protein 1 [Geosmithia morbida]KAF4125429.1 Tetratricopeptide repeat protein 1 [Geosmithia morbida]